MNYDMSKDHPDLEHRLFDSQSDANQDELDTTELVADQVQKTVAMCVASLVKNGIGVDWRGLVSGVAQGVAAALSTTMIDELHGSGRKAYATVREYVDQELRSEWIDELLEQWDSFAARRWGDLFPPEHGLESANDDE